MSHVDISVPFIDLNSFNFGEMNSAAFTNKNHTIHTLWDSTGFAVVSVVYPSVPARLLG